MDTPKWLTDLKEFAEDHATTTEIRMDLLSLIDAEIEKQKVKRQRCEHCDTQRYEYDRRKREYVAVIEKFCPYCGGEV